jgi:L-ascorbate metabolism protein UlaG (beta-lactamase superfamily)
LIDFDGHRVLTDPWFSERFGYYHGEPYGIALADLPRLDAVVVTHAHYDHYDLGAFRAYPERAVPMVVKPRAASAQWRRPTPRCRGPRTMPHRVPQAILVSAMRADAAW